MTIKSIIEDIEEDKRCRFFNTAEEIGMSIEETKNVYEVLLRLKTSYGKDFVNRLVLDDNFSKGIEDAISYIQGFQFMINQWKPITFGVIR